ncbi:MAG: cytochrome b/b6 domain-containing protein [Candidatus Aquicultorales bacterium]
MVRAIYAVGWLIIVGGGSIWAYGASRMVMKDAGAGGSYTYDFLFNSYVWLIPLVIILGVFAGALRKDERPRIEDGKVLRHVPTGTFAEHWSVALGGIALMISGISLGFFFIPRFASDPEAIGFAMNFHFIGVLLFLFGLTYHIVNRFLTGDAKDFVPSASDVGDAIAHYKAVLGMSSSAPAEGRFLGSQKLAYLGWGVILVVLALTGLVKVSAHVWAVPAGLMGIATSVHDLFALFSLLFLVFHVVMGALLPASWPLVRSLFTGYASKAYVEEHHALWYEELKNAKEPTAEPKASASPVMDWK